MIKEYLIAIVLGCLLGFGVTGGYYNLKSKQKPPSPSTITAPTPASENGDHPSSENSSDQNTLPSSSLLIITPENHSIVDNSKLIIEGSTTPQSTIVINTPIDSYITDSGESGGFQLKVGIESGFNIVQIVAIDSEDNQSETELIITYSTAKI